MQIAALKEQGKGLSKEQRRWEDNLERLSEAIKRQTAEYKCASTPRCSFADARTTMGN